MNVILDENILSIKKIVNSHNKVDKIRKYKDFQNLKFQKIIECIGLDDSMINEIRIIPFNKELGHFGETKPIIVDNKLKFDIIFQDIIIFWSDDKSQEMFKYAVSVIFHEFYHCKEINITSQYLDVKKAYFSPFLDTTYKFLFSLALHQFSEYYAHFYSSKIYYESIKFNDYITNSYASLSALSDFAKENNDVQWTPLDKHNIETFIHKCVVQLARYHSTKNDSHIHLLDEYKGTELFNKHYEYYIRLDKILSEAFKYYPQNLSEEFMINLGKDLMYIMNLYDLTYSTEDLSDNFIFVHKENLNTNV